MSFTHALDFYFVISTIKVFGCPVILFYDKSFVVEYIDIAGLAFVLHHCKPVTFHLYSNMY